jgi:adenylate kinase
MIRLLILAPPGGGKSTQARQLAADYRVPHISTGDLLRDHIARSTPLGTKAKPFLERGDLAPDELVIGVVRERICGPPLIEEFVLDGFPRTLEEAEVAHTGARKCRITLTAVVHLIVSETEVVRRLLKRGRVSGRSDDTETTIRHRLVQYHSITEPLVDLYRRRELLIDVNGEGPAPEVTERIERVLASRGVSRSIG